MQSGRPPIWKDVPRRPAVARVRASGTLSCVLCGFALVCPLADPMQIPAYSRVHHDVGPFQNRHKCHESGLESSFPLDGPSMGEGTLARPWADGVPLSPMPYDASDKHTSCVNSLAMSRIPATVLPLIAALAAFSLAFLSACGGELATGPAPFSWTGRPLYPLYPLSTSAKASPWQ